MKKEKCVFALIGMWSIAWASITPQIGASRTTGIAPLAVFVDATATAGLGGNDYINANFDWNFDKNNLDSTGKHVVTRGFVAAHVYENPGTYTLQLIVHDRLGAGATTTTQVTVTPFTGTTYYVASNGNDSAAGASMSAPLATPEYAVQKKGGPNTRILLRKGDKFTITEMFISDKTGPMIVGSYIDPNKPSTELPMMYCAHTGDGMINLSKSSDCRFMDFHLRSLCPVPHDGTKAGNRAGTIYPDTRDILILRIEVDSVNRCGFMGSGLNTFIFDCYYHDYGTYGYYGDSLNRFAFVGNISRRLGDGQHYIRTQGGSKGFFAYNDDAQSDVNYDEITFRGSTSQIYALENRFDQCISIHPQNSGVTENESYCVIDGNLVRSGGVPIAAKHIAVRNNILFNCGISLDNHPLVGMSDDVTIMNNTCFGEVTEIVMGSATNAIIKNNIFSTTTTLGYAKGLYLENALSNYKIDNNIYYAPNKGGPLWFCDSGVNLGEKGFANWQAAGADAHSLVADPLFASTDSSSSDFLKLSANSPARGAGAAGPVFSDMTGTPRPAGQPTDAGARLFGSASARPFAPVSHIRRAEFNVRTMQAFDIQGRRVRMSNYRSMHGVVIFRVAPVVRKVVLF